jgi:dynein intermediate chain 3, axonemal
VQNEITNIFQDDFAALAEEDGVSGNRRETSLQEYQSFTDLIYSKNKVGCDVAGTR